MLAKVYRDKAEQATLDVPGKSLLVKNYTTLHEANVPDGFSFSFDRYANLSQSNHRVIVHPVRDQVYREKADPVVVLADVTRKIDHFFEATGYLLSRNVADLRVFTINNTGLNVHC